MQLKVTKKDLFNVPNILTYVRILCIPAFALVFFLLDTPIKGNTGYSLGCMLAFGIFLFASATDLVDGRIARKYNLTTDIGALLDPLADKLLQGVAVICLCIGGNMHWIFPALFVLKELYMVVGAAFLANKNIVGKANVYGKIAAFIMAIGILLAYFIRPAALWGYWVPERIVDVIVFSVGLAISYFAAFSYTVMVAKQLKDKGYAKASNVKLDFSTPHSDIGAPDEVEQDSEQTDTDANE